MGDGLYLLYHLLQYTYCLQAVVSEVVIKFHVTPWVCIGVGKSVFLVPLLSSPIAHSRVVVRPRSSVQDSKEAGQAYDAIGLFRAYVQHY